MQISILLWNWEKAMCDTLIYKFNVPATNGQAAMHRTPLESEKSELKSI